MPLVANVAEPLRTLLRLDKLGVGASPRERAGVGGLEVERRVTAWQLARDELAEVLGTGARVEECVAHEGDEVVELGGGEGDRVGELRVEGGEQRCGRTDRTGEITW